MKKSFLVNPIDLLKEYGIAGVEKTNILHLLIVARKKLEQSCYGNGDRSEAIEIFGKCEDSQEYNEWKDVQENASSQYSEIKKERQELLGRFMNTLTTKACDWNEISNEIASYVALYKPKYDENATLSQVVKLLEDSKLKAIVDIEELLKGKTCSLRPANISASANPNSIAHVKSVNVQLTYADSDDWSEPLRERAVLFWEYEKNSNEIVISDKNKIPRVGIAKTDQNGFLRYCLGYTSSGKYAAALGKLGCVVEENGLNFINISGTGRKPALKFEAMEPKHKVEQYRNRMKERLSFNKKGKAEPIPDNKPKDVDDTLDGLINGANGKKLIFDDKVIIKPGRKYGFFVYPLEAGHFKSIDVNKLVSMEINANKGVRNAATVVDVPLETTKENVVVPVHCTLPEWNHRIVLKLAKMVSLLALREDEANEHTPNLTKIEAIKQLTEYHKKYSFDTLKSGNVSNHDKLMNDLGNLISEYNSVVTKDTAGIQKLLDTVANELLQILTSNDFNKEFCRFAKSVNESMEEVRPGPYMKMDTGWQEIFQTYEDCIMVLAQTSKADEMFNSLAVPYLLAMTNADDHSKYQFDKDYIDLIASQVQDTNSPLLSLISNKEPVKLEYPWTKSEKEKFQVGEGDQVDKIRLDNVVAVWEEIFRNGIIPSYAFVNKMPGPPSPLQSIVYNCARQYPEFMLRNAGKSNPSFHHVGNSVTFVVQWLMRKENFNEEEWKEFHYLLTLYRANPNSVTEDGSTKVATELQRRILSSSDVSSGYKYRTFCSTVSFFFVVSNIYTLAIRENKDAEYYLTEAVPGAINLLYASAIVTKVQSSRFLDTGIGNYLSKYMDLKGLPVGAEKFATIVGNALAIYTATVFLYEGLKDINIGDYEGAMENFANTIVSIGFLLGQSLIGVGALGAIILGIAVAIQIGLIIYQWVKDESDAEAFIISIYEGLEPLWIKFEQGEKIDLRSDDMKKIMETINDYIKDEIKWTYYNWKSVIPMNKIGLGIKEIAMIAKIRSKPESDFGSSGLDDSNHVRRVHNLVYYYHRLQLIVEKSSDMEKNSVLIFKEMIESLEKGEFTTTIKHPFHLPDYYRLSGTLEDDKINPPVLSPFNILPMRVPGR